MRSMGVSPFGLLCLVVLSLLLVEPGRSGDLAPAAAGRATATAARTTAKLGRLPVRFEPNVGQFDAPVRFVARRGATTLFLTDAGATASLAHASSAHETKRSVVSWTVAGARAVAPEASAPLATRTNYFIGNDPSRWRSNVATFARATYRGVRPGVDVVYHGENGTLEYDFVLAPGAHVDDVAMDVAGAQAVTIDDHGALDIHTASGDLVQPRPRVYQTDDLGREQDVAAGYRLLGPERVGFVVAAYDTSRQLVIDPVIAYATYLGGAGDDVANAVVADASGNAYVAGNTQSTDFPLKTAEQSANGGGYDAYVAKLDPTGGALVYATYLGGSGTDLGYGIGVDSGGNVVVSGYTTSANFPLASALQGALSGLEDLFVTKLDAAGSALTYSTYLGGSGPENCNPGNLAVDSSGNAYVTGYTSSADFPVKNALQSASGGGGNDAFVVKLAAAGTQIYGTYLGGSGDDVGTGIATDGTGVAVVAGFTTSTDFPVVSPVQAASAGGGHEAFVAKIGATGAAVYATYLGGSGDDVANGVACDASSNAYVVGQTSSTDFPIVNGAQTTHGGTSDAFLTKLSASGSAVVYSTFLGGSGNEAANAVRVDANGSASFVGSTTGGTFPTKNPIQAAFGGGGSDAFAAQLDVAGSAFAYATFLGGASSDVAYGAGIDTSGSLYLCGISGGGFLTSNAVQPAFAGVDDGFIAKIATPPLALTPASATVAPSGTKTFVASGGLASSYTFDLQNNASGGTIDGAGVYKAGTTGSVVDVVRVTDGAGTTATANVTVTASLKISPASPAVAPLGTVAFTATGGGGGNTWSLSAAPSGGTIDAVSGAYAAGATASTADTVKVTDSLGNTATVNVSVGAGITINPSTPSVATRQPVTFTATGGSGVGYTWAFVSAPPSGGTLTAGGSYQAGSTGSVTDKVKVTDSLGNTASVDVVVGPSIAITPAAGVAAPKQSIAFAVSGGSGKSPAWAFTTNASGGTLDATTGKYVAGPTGNVNDVIKVTDSLGNTISATIAVGAPLAMAAAGPTPPRSTLDLAASGGGAPYAWSFVTNASGGTLDPATGKYTAGSTGSKTDVVKVTDAFGSVAQRNIKVTAGVTITPASASLPPLGAVTLAASGGSATGFVWTIPTNKSGATIDAAGNYKAGATGAVTDTVQVADSLGNTATINVSVGGGLAITPAAPSTPPKGSVAFTATGGSNAGYTWSLSPNRIRRHHQRRHRRIQGRRDRQRHRRREGHRLARQQHHGRRIGRRRRRHRPRRRDACPAGHRDLRCIRRQRRGLHVGAHHECLGRQHRRRDRRVQGRRDRHREGRRHRHRLARQHRQRRRHGVSGARALAADGHRCAEGGARLHDDRRRRRLHVRARDERIRRERVVDVGRIHRGPEGLVERRAARHRRERRDDDRRDHGIGRRRDHAGRGERAAPRRHRVHGDGRQRQGLRVGPRDQRVRRHARSGDRRVRRRTDREGQRPDRRRRRSRQHRRGEHLRRRWPRQRTGRADVAPERDHRVHGTRRERRRLRVDDEERAVGRRHRRHQRRVQGGCDGGRHRRHPARRHAREHRARLGERRAHRLGHAEDQHRRRGCLAELRGGGRQRHRLRMDAGHERLGRHHRERRRLRRRSGRLDRHRPARRLPRQPHHRDDHRHAGAAAPSPAASARRPRCVGR